VPALPGAGGLNGIPAQDVHGIAQAPLLPYRLSNFVLAILGLTNYAPYASNSAHVNTSVVKPQQGNSNSCIALTGLPSACNLPSNFAANYGLNGLYKQSANGSGQTLAIVTLAAVNPGAPQYFWNKTDEGSSASLLADG
jgi:subtilase family serine protease